MKNTNTAAYILGFDIGSNSIGWAALRIDDDEVTGILRSGVRVFPAGVEGNLEQGREESRAAKRREARLRRRQTDRRCRRLTKVYNLLASWHLLPKVVTPQERNEILQQLDRDLSHLYGTQVLPYFLRARGLDHRLEPFELGRAFYHLARRRGFLSNRKANGKETDDERSKVKSGIKNLYSEMESAGARTLGEYLAGLDPHEPGKRIRSRWTHRQMFIDEFTALWEAQQLHHPDALTADRRDQLFAAMFTQRPLRDQSDLIGSCEYIPTEKRAPMWHPLSQRFRMLQVVNDLRLLSPAGTEIPITTDERSRLLDALDRKGDLTWAKVRKLLGITKAVEINRERGGEKKLVGNRTEAKLREVFLDRWDTMTSQERFETIQDAAEEIEEESLIRKAKKRWGLNDLKAAEYAELRLETGKYLSLSLEAVKRLLPRMETGEAYMTVAHDEFPETFRCEVSELLPPLVDCTSLELRNPAVRRALTELRKIVNALIREYGKPDEVHIELARDLKQPKSIREQRWKRMRQREAERLQAIERIRAEGGPQEPSRRLIEQMLLAMECHWICPYTGRAFGYGALERGEVQIEHIIPFSRSLDDSYLNKTLCYADENKRKGNRTPWEYYGDGPNWEDILGRVAGFDTPLAREKLRRFQMKEEEVSELLSDFTSRQLNDTRYTSKLASKYLARLYGGVDDADGRKRIYVCPGQATAYLRRLWGLNRILSDDAEKNRGDHRQHAIDAVVVALTGPKWVKALADAAFRAQEAGRRRFASLEEPWPRFIEELRSSILGIKVSHRPDRSLGGAFHDETFYGRRMLRTGNEVVTVRKAVDQLKAGEVDRIVDPVVRDRVRLALGLVEGKAQKLADPANAPTLPTRDGREIPIRRVRIRTRITGSLRPIGAGARTREVAGGDNQHFEVFAVLDDDGKPKKWDCAIVSKFDAAERLRRGEPIVCRNHGPNTRFEFTIAKNDVLEIGPANKRRLVVIKTLESTRQVGIVDISDARPVNQKNQNRKRPTINQLMSKHACRKVLVTPLGLVVPCND